MRETERNPGRLAAFSVSEEWNHSGQEGTDRTGARSGTQLTFLSLPFLSEKCGKDLPESSPEAVKEETWGSIQGNGA